METRQGLDMVMIIGIMMPDSHCLTYQKHNVEKVLDSEDFVSKFLLALFNKVMLLNTDLDQKPTL